jgi:hypothetical protein
MLKPAASELIAAPNAPAGASRIPTIAVSSRSKRRLRLKRVISGHVRAGVATHDFRNEETMNENVHRCSSPEKQRRILSRQQLAQCHSFAVRRTALLEGLDVAAAAGRMRVALGTARFMLKSVFHKTGTHRQSELMRFLLGLPNVAVIR